MIATSPSTRRRRAPLFIVDGIAMVLWAAATRGKAAFLELRRSLFSGFVAGTLSFGSYWVAVWAFTRAPIGVVAALRETSVLWAILIGTLVLGERGGRWRWSAAVLIAGGMAALRISP